MARGMVEVELVDDEPPGHEPRPGPATTWLLRFVAAADRGARRAARSGATRTSRAWRRWWVRLVAGGVVAAAVSGRAGTVSVVGLEASTEAHRWSTVLWHPPGTRPAASGKGPRAGPPGG